MNRRSFFGSLAAGWSLLVAKVAPPSLAPPLPSYVLALYDRHGVGLARVPLIQGSGSARVTRVGVSYSFQIFDPTGKVVRAGLLAGNCPNLIKALAPEDTLNISDARMDGELL